MSKKIHGWSVEGEFLDDSKMAEARKHYEQFMLADAREQGYVPVLDLDSNWSPEYDLKEDRWFFSLTMYFVYIGKQRAKIYEGLSNNCLVPTPSPKPAQS